MEKIEEDLNTKLEEKPKNEIIIEKENTEEKKTFKRIKELQSLIKKKSEMKEYCM
jgi:hypothetical protein